MSACAHSAAALCILRYVRYVSFDAMLARKSRPDSGLFPVCQFECYLASGGALRCGFMAGNRPREPRRSALAHSQLMNSTLRKRSVVPERTADDKIPVLLTVSEVAWQLRIHKSVMYDWLRRGDIAYYRVGRLIRIRESDLASFIKRNRVDTRPKSVYGCR